MLNVKNTLVAVTLTAFTASLAGGVMADRDGKGWGGKGWGGKRGGDKIERMCSAEHANKSAERKSELLGKLNLNPEQMALFYAAQAGKEATKQQVCSQFGNGEITDEARGEIRSIMKESRQANKEAHKAFKDSLTDEQKQVMKEMRKGKKGKNGKRGQRHGHGSSDG